MSKKKEPRKYSLVKHINPIPNQTSIWEGKQFVYFGEVPNMPGHSVVIEIDKGVGGSMYLLHTSELVELTEEET